MVVGVCFFSLNLCAALFLPSAFSSARSSGEVPMSLCMTLYMIISQPGDLMP